MIKSGQIWHQNNQKPPSAPLFAWFSQSFRNLNYFPALQMVDVCTHPSGLTKIIRRVLWLGCVSIRHDLRAACGDVCFQILCKIFHIRKSLAQKMQFPWHLVPVSTSVLGIACSSHTFCPLHSSLLLQQTKEETPQWIAPPNRIITISLWICELRKFSFFAWYEKVEIFKFSSFKG